MKVLIADDHALFRDGVRVLLRPLAKNVTFCEADTYHSVTEALSLNPAFDLVFLDYLMPGLSGVEGVRSLVKRFPESPLLVVSAMDEPALMAAILETGVAGFFPKSHNATVLLGAIRLILSGGKYIPEGLVLPRQKGLPAVGTLTQRQSQVLRLLLEGSSNQEIAQAMELSLPTVKMHVRNLFRVLGVANRMKAVIRAKELGLMTETAAPPATGPVCGGLQPD